ncbi:MAG TPA: Mur ligase family protein, partial [Hyphomicrobium sp.]|nr:Mur ligase family protein [Hyphomicrobium sp.]
YSTISVTGTHGKTTTTSLLSHIFTEAGEEPTVITGGIINAWGSNARLGQGKWMIVEADESDGTFTRLPTEIGIVTNIDPEHLDYFGSVEAMHREYEAFLRNIPFFLLGMAVTVLFAIGAYTKRDGFSFLWLAVLVSFTCYL